MVSGMRWRSSLITRNRDRLGSTKNSIGRIAVRAVPRVKSGTTPTTWDGWLGGGRSGMPGCQRPQETVLPMAAAGLEKPRKRAPVSLSTTVGWASGDGSGRSSTMSSPRALVKKRPATGFRPCTSKKPTPTWPT